MNVANHRKLLRSVSREFSAKIKNGKHFLYFEDKEVAQKIRNQRHCSKRRIKGSGAKKIHDSKKDICYGLRKKAIQILLNIQKNIRFSNNAVLRPIRAKFV